MRCPCLEHGDCPIEHLAERVAALEQLVDAMCGYTTKLGKQAAKQQPCSVVDVLACSKAAWPNCDQCCEPLPTCEQPREGVL